MYIYIYIYCIHKMFQSISPHSPNKASTKKKTRFLPGKDQAVCPGLDGRVVLGEGVFHKRHVVKGLTPHINSMEFPGSLNRVVGSISSPN